MRNDGCLRATGRACRLRADRHRRCLSWPPVVEVKPSGLRTGALGPLRVHCPDQPLTAEIGQAGGM